MVERLMSNALPAKMLRLALSFALVFWVSFRAECLAFADVVPANLATHENEALSDFKVRPFEYRDNSVLKSSIWSMSETEQGKQQKSFPKVMRGGSMTFVATDLEWKQTGGESGGGESGGNEGSESGGSTEPGGESGGGTEPSGGEGGEPTEPDPEEPGEPTEPEDETVVESTEPVSPVSTQAQGDDITVADFMTWSVSDDSLAEISWSNGIATFTGKQPGRVTVYGDLWEGAQDLVKLPSDFSGEHLIAFDVQIMYVESIALFSADPDSGAEPIDGKEITLDEASRAEFGFWAQVTASDGLTEDDTLSYTVAPGKALHDVSRGFLENLTWSVHDAQSGDSLGDDVASITQDTGVLTMPGEGPIVVKCSTSQGLDAKKPYERSVTVKTGNEPSQEEDEALQGESHPQNKLTVEVVRPATPVAADGEGEGDQTGEQGNDGSTQEAPASDSEQSADAADPDTGDIGSDDGQPKTTTTTKEYGYGDGVTDGVTDVESLGIASKTYQVNVGGQVQTITGRGFTLAKLLDDAGVTAADRENIDTLEFVNFYGTSTVVSWHDLVVESQAEDTYVTLAVQSYVHPASGAAEAGGAENQDGPAEGDNPEASSEAQPAGEEAIPMLDNTRFRLLYDDAGGRTGVNFDSARWINKVIVHMNLPKDTTKKDDSLRVRIDYVPVPKGQVAFLSAVPNQEIGSSHFGFTWERSTDEGATWTALDADSVQTLRVPTDDDHIGNLYRVTLDTDMVDEKTGETRGDTSDPVTIEEGTGFMVVLDYIPPIAGDWANFQSHLVITDGSSPTVEYCWEKSTDGGTTWKGINGDDTWVRDDALHVKTNPINESASSDSSDEPVVLTYVRVRAHADDGRNATSNACPLTVRVGDENTDVGGNTGDDKSSEITQVINEDGGESTDAEQTAKPKKETKVVPVDVTRDEAFDDDFDDEFDDEEDEEEVEQGDVGTEKTPSELVVDKKVNKKVAEQKQQAEAKKAATPGARWTELATVNPTADDVKRVLADNPFAPFAMPLALGVTAAGIIEKLVAFRRQL